MLMRERTPVIIDLREVHHTVLEGCGFELRGKLLVDPDSYLSGNEELLLVRDTGFHLNALSGFHNGLSFLVICAGTYRSQRDQ